MPHHHEKGRTARSFEFCIQPSELLCLLLWRQSDVSPFAHAAVWKGHVTVEREKRDERMLLRKFKTIPARGHGPPSLSAAGVLQFSVNLTLRPWLIIMVPQDGVGRARK